MERMQREIRPGRNVREIIGQPRILFYLFGIIILILYHLRYDLSFGDAVNLYGNVLKRGSEYFPSDGNVFEAVWRFSVFHYMNWSSRNIIEAVFIIVAVFPAIFWHILDILAVVLIGYSLDKLVLIKNMKIKYLSIFSFLMMYQVITMRSAGWVATTINYSWVVAMGLYMYLTIQRIRREEYVAKLSYGMSVLAALYAMNHEQMNGMMLLLFGVILFRDFRNKKLKRKVLPFFVINLLEFFWILFCPGNANRRVVEAVSYFEDFLEFSFQHKIYEGISSLLRALFDVRGMVIVTFSCSIILFYLVFQKKSAIWVKILVIIPTVYIVAKVVREIFFMMTGKVEANALFLDYRQSKWAAAFGCMVLICFFVAGYHITKEVEERDLLIAALCAAAATKIVLGFSLAFLVSGERTSIYLTFSLIMSALFLIEKFEDFFLFLEKKACVFGIVVINIGLFLWNYLLILSGEIV